MMAGSSHVVVVPGELVGWDWGPFSFFSYRAPVLLQSSALFVISSLPFA